MDEKEVIQQILDLEDYDIEKTIEQRISELEENAIEDREELSPFTVMRSRAMGVRKNPEVIGYIPQKTKIAKSGIDISSFVIDDMSFYKTIIDFIKGANPDNVKRGDLVNNNYIMQMIQRIIINYFGLKATESARNALYDSKTDIENDDCILSISDFKRNNTGMCVERSAVAQNILSFLGYNPMMIYGFASNERDGVNVGHAFNCIIRNGKGMLIDFSNPIYKDGKYFRPATFPINQETLQAFMEGKGQIEVQHKDFYTENGELKETITNWVYSSGEIDPKYFANSKKSESINPQDISKGTKGVGLTEINNSTNDIGKSQMKDLTEEQQKS